MTVGDRILGYRLERALGQGGMGIVYKAVHDTLGQEVAVKVLDPVLAKIPEVRERFVQEARIQIGLRHVAIVRVLTAQVDQEPLALVMEYVDGMSLEQVLQRRGALEVDEALGIISQVLAAVGYAHSRGVIHRDLKPSNIMVTADGHAKVMDFGIAKVVGNAKLTKTGTTMGSPHYMSPEQVLGRKDVDDRTDIYSLGATLFEMVTGRAPFEDRGLSDSDSDFLVKQAHVGKPAPDPREFNPSISQRVAWAIMKALQKAPAMRFQDAAGFAAALMPGQTESARDGQMVTSERRKEERPPSSEETAGLVEEVAPAAVRRDGAFRGEARRKKARWYAVAGGGGILVIILAFAMLAKNGHGDAEVARSDLEVARNDLPASAAELAPVIRNSIGIELVRIPAGTFMMGSGPDDPDADGDEVPRRQVTISQPFYMSKTEVTQEQWEAAMGSTWEKVMGSNPSFFVGSANPVENVSWDDVQTFIGKLNDREGGGRYRLPTEAEWEYACRAGTTKARYGDLDKVAWWEDNSDAETHPVGKTTPNAWGLYDMLGNVREWCQDWYGPYPSGQVTDPTGPATGSYRVFRGGSWDVGDGYVRAAERGNTDPGSRRIYLGFRLARSLAN